MDEQRDHDEDEWRFTLEDVEGEEPQRSPIEPGSPSLENVLFVLLGIVAMSAVIWHVSSVL